jgi:hypothetical protein
MLLYQVIVRIYYQSNDPIYYSWQQQTELITLSSLLHSNYLLFFKFIQLSNHEIGLLDLLKPLFTFLERLFAFPFLTDFVHCDKLRVRDSLCIGERRLANASLNKMGSALKRSEGIILVSVSENRVLFF